MVMRDRRNRVHGRLLEDLELLEILGASRPDIISVLDHQPRKEVIELKPTCPTGCPVGKTATVDGRVVCPRCGTGIIYK